MLKLHLKTISDPTLYPDLQVSTLMPVARGTILSQSVGRSVGQELSGRFVSFIRLSNPSYLTLGKKKEFGEAYDSACSKAVVELFQEIRENVVGAKTPTAAV